MISLGYYISFKKKKEKKEIKMFVSDYPHPKTEAGSRGDVKNQQQQQF